MASDQTQSKHYLKATTISSGIAQIFTKLIIHPIDTLKTKQQITVGINAQQNNLSRTIKNTIASDGIKGFYKGVFISAFGSAPAFGLYMTTYQYTKKQLSDQPLFKEREGFKHFCSGMMAEVVACTIFLPIDVTKERMQVQSNLKIYNYRNGIHAIQEIVANEGIKGIYRGYGATLAHFGPWSAFYFFFYEKYKKLLLPDAQKPKFYESFFTAACAGVSSSFFVNWVDVVKVRLQIQRAQQAIKPQQETVLDNQKQYSPGNYGYKNLVHGVYTLIKNEGPLALFKGFGAKILLVAPSTALSMGLTEQIRFQLLQNYFDKEN